MQQTASDREKRSDPAFCGAVSLVRVWDCDLLLDTLIFIEVLEQVGLKVTCSIVANKPSRLAELLLDLENVVLDAVLAFRFGLQKESLHAPTCFIKDE